MTDKSEPFDLRTTFVKLRPDGDARPCRVTRAVWQGSASGPRDRVVGRFCFQTQEDLHSDAWEMHAHSDELIVLLRGVVDVVFEGEAGAAQTVHRMTGSQACVVPAGAWHRLVPIEPGELMFINTRNGTAHRAVP